MFASVLTKVYQQEQRISRLKGFEASGHRAARRRLTMAMAAAATAVLTGVPGTTLLSEVLTSTARMKRLPEGSTF